MHVQEDLNLRILCVFEGTISLDATNIIYIRDVAFKASWNIYIYSFIIVLEDVCILFAHFRFNCIRLRI